MFIAVSGASDYRLPFYFPEASPEERLSHIFLNKDFSVPPATDADVVAIIGGNRACMAELDFRSWIRGKGRTPPIDFAARIQDQWSTASGKEISLLPRARAMIVWEFTDGTHAFSYLDAARDAVHDDLKVIKAENRLLIFPSVRAAILEALSNNTTGVHNEFTDIKRWRPSELERLEADGIIALQKDPRGRITGVSPLKTVARKKIAIFTEEQVGYRQFQLEPTNIGAYRKWAQSEGVNPPGTYDAKEAFIQKQFFDLLCL